MSIRCQRSTTTSHQAHFPSHQLTNLLENYPIDQRRLKSSSIPLQLVVVKEFERLLAQVTSAIYSFLDSLENPIQNQL